MTPTNAEALTVGRVLPWMHHTPDGVDEFDAPIHYPAYLLANVATGHNY